MDKYLADREHSVRQVKEERTLLKKAKRSSRHALRCQQILQAVAQKVQETTHARVSEVVAKCLQAVFGGEYQFRIEFQRARGRTEARPIFVKDGIEFDPTEEGSGGVCDVTSFALRLACLLLTKPARRKFVVLDEPFRHLDPERQRLAGEMIKTLAEELGAQFLVVTHAPHLNCGKVVRLG